LTIAQKQVEVMGGQIFLESEQRKGSRFFFTVPLKVITKGITKKETESKRTVIHLAEGYHVKALIVDDIDDNREILGKLLSDIGVEVQLAGSGQKAIELVRQSLPDVVFMDIHMPNMNGLEASKQIWGELGRDSLKIVAVSASTMVHEREQYLFFGFDAFLPKPFHEQQLYDCLASVLRTKYQYAEEALSDTEETLNLSEITLSKELMLHLKEAAEFYRFTDLKQYIDDVEQLDSNGQRLAEYLRRFANNYEMDAVLRVLEEIT